MPKKGNSRFILLFLIITFISNERSLAQEPSSVRPDVITVNIYSDTLLQRLMVQTNQVYEAGLDTLPQILFWRRIMNMTPDSGLVTLAKDRTVYCSMLSLKWDALGEAGQNLVRDSLRKANALSDSAAIYFTKGKNDFYDASAVIPQIDRAIPIFSGMDVDPFYAQAILLIESPGKTLKSNVGAMGAFQLMKPVAIQMGLKVNKYVDERKDFDKSAAAAAKLLKTICIPLTNKMLDKRGITYNPNDLWYRLLVLHVYHAGSGNVDKALSVIDPCDGGMDVIEQLWQTKAGQFGKSSQAYSQLAIAALIELDVACGKYEAESARCKE
jgi:hypothetical protein